MSYDFVALCSMLVFEFRKGKCVLTLSGNHTHVEIQAGIS